MAKRRKVDGEPGIVDMSNDDDDDDIILVD